MLDFRCSGDRFPLQVMNFPLGDVLCAGWEELRGSLLGEMAE